MTFLSETEWLIKLCCNKVTFRISSIKTPGFYFSKWIFDPKLPHKKKTGPAGDGWLGGLHVTNSLLRGFALCRVSPR